MWMPLAALATICSVWLPTLSVAYCTIDVCTALAPSVAMTMPSMPLPQPPPL